MQITLTPEQVDLLRSLVEPVYRAHLDAESEPPGFSISMSFLGSYGNHAVGHCGSLSIDLGELSVQPEQVLGRARPGSDDSPEA